MKIFRKLTTEELDRLKELMNIPSLLDDDCGQNNCYYGVDKDVNSEYIREIESILSKIIGGFSSFNNFKSNEIIRFQYDYSFDMPNSPYFTDVGYLSLDDIMELGAK